MKTLLAEKTAVTRRAKQGRHLACRIPLVAVEIPDAPTEASRDSLCSAALISVAQRRPRLLTRFY